jgi:hypothetical protein
MQLDKVPRIDRVHSGLPDEPNWHQAKAPHADLFADRIFRYDYYCAGKSVFKGRIGGRAPVFQALLRQRRLRR